MEDRTGLWHLTISGPGPRCGRSLRPPSAHRLWVLPLAAQFIV